MSAPAHRIDAIDGLRAIAVLAVVVYHLIPAALPGGYIGVDIFFVISGYVVCSSLLKTSTESFTGFLGTFYTKRILRICPALIAMLLVTGFLSRLFIPDAWLTGSSMKTGLFAFFGISNFRLIHDTRGYFVPTGDFNPYLHTWSLAVEEQFYLVFPLLIFLQKRLLSQGPRFTLLAAALLPLAGLLSFACSIYQTQHAIDHAYFMLPSRFWEMTAGALLCLAHQKQRLLPASAAFSSLLCGAGLASFAAALIYTSPALFPYPWALAPVLGTVFCITGIIAQPAGVMTRGLATPVLAYIGRISFSLYLWHWPVFVLFRWTVGLESAATMLLALAATLVLTHLSYFLVERRFRYREASPAQHPTPARPWLRWPALSYQRKVLTAGILGNGLAAALYLLVSKSTSLPLSVTMEPHERAADWRLHAPGIRHHALSPGDEGLRWSGKRLFVLGDSHAHGYIEMLHCLREKHGLAIYLDAVGGRQVGSLVTTAYEIDPASEARMLANVQKLARPGDVVLLANLRVLRLADQFTQFDVERVIQERDSAAAETERQQAVERGKTLIRRLEQLGLTVLIDAPKPVLAAPAFRCADWFNQTNPIGRAGYEMDREFLLRHRAAAMRSIAEIQREFPRVQLWDPFPILCPADHCSAFDGNKPLFFDADHLSGYGNRKLYPDFEKKLEQIWDSAQIQFSDRGSETMR